MATHANDSMPEATRAHASRLMDYRARLVGAISISAFVLLILAKSTVVELIFRAGKIVGYGTKVIRAITGRARHA